MRWLIVAYGVLAAVSAPGPGRAQPAWPPATVKIIVPFGPGSTPDIVGRLLAESYQKEFPASNFIVENKTGGGGDIGVEAVARATPDGATIGLGIGGPLAINALLFDHLRYNPATDIAPVTQLVSQSSILVVNAGLKVASVAELLDLLRKNPGKYSFASIGVGSLSHLAMEAIAQKAGAQMGHAPFASSPAAMLEVMRGDAPIACLPSAAVTAQQQSGQIRMLAVSTATRSPFLPDLPTLKESGVDVEADTWLGLIAPGGTPPAIVDRLRDMTAAALASPAIAAKLAALQMQPVGNTPAEFRAVIDAETGRWGPVIKAAKIHLEGN